MYASPHHAETLQNYKLFEISKKIQIKSSISRQIVLKQTCKRCLFLSSEEVLYVFHKRCQFLMETIVAIGAITDAQSLLSP